MAEYSSVTENQGERQAIIFRYKNLCYIYNQRGLSPNNKKGNEIYRFVMIVY
jgi:hypothetical protein